MPTPTTHIGLLKPTINDSFSTVDLAANWQKCDDFPGTKVCTSTTRPSDWDGSKQGMEIAETDTGLKWRWNGTAFVRAAPSGLLKTTGGGWARGQRTVSFSTTLTSYSVVVAISNVVVPDGLRTLMLIATWPRVTNPNGLTAMSIYRSNVNAQAPMLASWSLSGDNSGAVQGAEGGGGSYVTYEADGLAAGTYNFSLQMASYLAGSASTANCSTATPVEISVIEI